MQKKCSLKSDLARWRSHQQLGLVALRLCHRDGDSGRRVTGAAGPAQQLGGPGLAVGSQTAGGVTIVNGIAKFNFDHNNRACDQRLTQPEWRLATVTAAVLPTSYALIATVTDRTGLRGCSFDDGPVEIMTRTKAAAASANDS